MIDFKIKGTKLPNLTIVDRLEYRCADWAKVYDEYLKLKN